MKTNKPLTKQNKTKNKMSSTGSITPEMDMHVGRLDFGQKGKFKF